MSYAHNFHSQGNTMHSNNWSFLARNSYSYNDNNVYSKNNRCRSRNTNHMRSSNNPHCGRYREAINNVDYLKSDDAPSWKRRKFSASAWGDTGRHYVPAKVNICAPSKCINSVAPTRSNAEAMTCTYKWDRSQLDDDEPVFMSRDEIERLSPSRKDGIDALRETHLRYSYCAFIQNLGFQLELPQTTIGTAMVLCHRFFVRRSHACHDRYVGSQLISTAAVFLAAKSEETPRPLNNVIRASSEILHKQDMTFMSFLLPVDWFEQYRERVTEAEQMILTTLNFELNVQHPYIPLTSVLKKLGLSQTVLVNLALNLVSEGLRSSLWLQFKPHQIAAGTAYLAAKFLNFDLSSHENIWQEFQTSPAILQEVTQQLMELL